MPVIVFRELLLEPLLYNHVAGSAPTFAEHVAPGLFQGASGHVSIARRSRVMRRKSRGRASALTRGDAGILECAPGAPTLLGPCVHLVQWSSPITFFWAAGTLVVCCPC